MRLVMSVAAALLMLAGHPAFACGPEVRVQFSEELPDRFLITFVRGPKMRLAGLTIDLTRSAAGAFFDGNDGLALQGDQPNAHGVSILSISYEGYSGPIAALTFDNFIEKKSVSFSSDLDDRGRASDPDQNHIYDGELEGAVATATLVSDTGRRIEIEGRFDRKGLAPMGERACV